MKKLFIILHALFITESTCGQIYPVSVNLQLNTALGPTLNHLTYPGVDQLNLILNLNDNSVSSLDVFLEFEISTSYFSIKSNYSAINQAITLTYGDVNFLSNGDLLEYFSPSAWIYSGNYSAFLYTQALIEGEYEICVRVFDANHPNQIQVSNTYCLTTYFSYSDPPQLNFPFCGSIVNSDLNQFFLQWNAIPDFESRSKLSYKLEIWELLYDENNYNQVVASTAPIFSFTTENSFYNYLPHDPILVQGRKYIWKVQVIDENESILFRNNGNSEICSFTYGESDLFNQIFGLELDIQTGNPFSAIAQWNDISIANHYQISYKKIGTESWFSIVTSENNCMLYNLEASTSYHGKVRYISNSDTSDWSNLKTFNTLNQNTISCNNQDNYYIPGEFEPLQLAVPGMNITIGQFVMQLIEVQPLTSSGRFKGRGNMLVYNSVPIAVEFSNIYIDQTLRVRDGTVKAISNGLGFWTAENSVGTLDNGNENAETKVDFNVDTIIITDGIISILGQNNEDVTIDLDTSYGNTIEDGGGDLFVVTITGEVLLVGNSGSGIGSIDPSLNYLDYEVGKGEFSSFTSQIYGYDHFVNPELQNYYNRIRIINTNSEKICDWKSVQTSKYDIIKFNLLELDVNYTIDSLIFVTGTGTVYYPKKNNVTYEITFVGGQHGDVQELFAGIKTENGIKFIDKIFLVNYNLQVKKLHVINFGSDQLPSKAIIESELSKVYLSSLVNWQVQISSETELPESWDLNHDESLEINSDLLSRYSDELKIWNETLKSKNYFDNETYYIIIPGVSASNNAVIAEMPRGKKIGYLFTNSADISMSIAHELAHGAFGLLHIFSGNSSLPQGSTLNLLDYPAGNNLFKYQWDLIQNPSVLTGLTDSDEEQFLYANSFVGPTINLINKNASFLTPTGKAISIPNITHGRFNVFGGLIWFKLKSGAEYGAVLNRNDDFFYGYVAKNDISKIEGVLTDEKIVILNNLLFSEFEFAEIDASVYANARLDLGDMLVVCVCDYTWNNNFKSNSFAEISSSKLIPENAEKENCLGQHCIDPNGTGIKNGAGRMLFVYNASFLSDGKNFSDFVDLCNWLTDTIQNNKFAFYGYNSEDFRGGNVFTQDHAKLFRQQDIFSKADLFQKFSFLISTTDYPFVFSTKNLWEGIPLGYNRNSIDHILYNQGIVKNYEYTFVDLVERESLKLNPWFVAIESMEAEGRCEPLSQSNYFQQYLAEFGTNSAFPYIANCASKWARDILMTYVGNLSAPTIGSSITLLSEMAGPALTSLVNSSSIAALSSGGGRIFFLYAFKKLTIDAFIGAAIDFLIQVAIEYYFLGDDNITFNECLSKVDYYEVGASALENAFCNRLKVGPGVLMSGGLSCVYDGFTEDGHLIDDFDYHDCAKGILTSILANSISHYALDKLKNISFDRFKIGIKKLSNFTDEKIDEVAAWVGVRRIVIRSIDDFTPSSGTRLFGNCCKTTTILGRWNPDMQIIKEKMLISEFNVGTIYGTSSNNLGGFNFLNISDDLAAAASDFFNQYNKPWLEASISRGDDIILATRPINKSDFFTLTGAFKGMYAEEINFLVQNNYKPINLSIEEWANIKSWFE